MRIESVDPNSFMWEEAYRPKYLKDVILPDHIRSLFESMVKNNEIKNLLFSSPSPGTGKTTTARALCHELGIDRPLFINASLQNSIDDIRTLVIQYASTVSLLGDGHIKVVILDEAERLSQAAQESLKGLMESVYANCRFIITTNSKNRIIDPLVSRCTEVDFTFSAEDKVKVGASMMRRCVEILQERGIPYAVAPIAELVKRYAPDNRKILSTLQSYALSQGKVDEGLIGQLAAKDATVLIEAMKTRKFEEVKAWVFSNFDTLQDDFYGRLYRSMEPMLVPQHVPEAILVINDYQRHHSTVPDRFVHFTAMCVELMMIDNAFKA